MRVLLYDGTVHGTYYGPQNNEAEEIIFRIISLERGIMAKTGATGITRIIKAGKYSMQGLRAAFVNEAAFRQESILAVIMIVAAVFLSRDVNGFNPLCFAALISGPFLVMTAEIINSALEAVVDRIGDEYHELSGRAKDMGSAAVFIALTYTVITWGLIILHVCTDLF